MAMEAVKQPNCLLWAAMPCTGASPWQNINRVKDGGEEKLQETPKVFHDIWSSFLNVAKVCHAHGGKIAIGWLTGCEYWEWQTTTNFIHKYQLNTVHITGCAVGLKTEEGIPILKPWQIATNDPYLWNALRGKLCPGKHVHPVHQKVE
eukprot:13576413-Heterocapsa_arctica.AAC.1